ncbi:MAG: DNA polymerase III subunit delta [Candidatus Marinimicrobia bacterium]|nr:DNA polymerase III subunit delta [Candidatus Neomarinimicrobiota bacterium]|tara:strand:- start:13795 stop:14781 length:987 start_codon:yes stop_codon:yes gene_type:complete
MNFKEVIINIRNGHISPVYFLSGDDYFLQSIFIDEITKALSSSLPFEKNLVSGEYGDYQNLINSLFSDSLFSEKRLFILRNPNKISGKTKDDLFKYLATPNINNCLIIIIDKVDKKTALFKNLSKYIQPLNVLPPFPSKMADWINFLINRSGLIISKEGKDLLREICGDSISHVANEIEKIKMCFLDNSAVGLKDIIKFCGWEREYFPWQLSDALGRRDTKGSFRIGKSLLSRGYDSSMIISQVGNFFQELYFFILPKIDKESLPKTGWISQSLVRKIPTYLNNFSINEIEKIILLLYKSDIQIKTGKLSGELLLIPLIYKITTCNVR